VLPRAFPCSGKMPMPSSNRNFQPGHAFETSQGTSWRNKTGQGGTPVRTISKTQRERRRILQAIFRGAEIRVKQGCPVRRAIRAAAKRWRGRRYQTGKLVRFSEHRLVALFYQWRRNGDSALVTRYAGPPSKLPPELVSKFFAACLQDDTFSMAEAWRDLAATSWSVFQMYRAVPATKRKAIRQYHAVARRAAAERTRLKRSLSVTPEPLTLEPK
jgi:hypothetical protein